MNDDVFALAVVLAFAHVLADFIFQPDWMARNKRNPGTLALHVITVALLTGLVTGPQHPVIIAVIAISHGLIDLIKAHADRDGSWEGFLLDQLAHFAVIVTVAVVLTAPSATLLPFALSAPFIDVQSLINLMVFATGLILAVRASGFLTGLFVAQFPQEVRTKIEGLPNGGAIIGQLERFLAFILIVSGSPAAVGFLIAAKSILRFGDITRHDERQVAEYVIIGTLVSFACAISIGMLTRWLMPGGL